MARLLERNRAEEMGAVDLDYLKAIHKFHEDWLLNQNPESEYYLAPKVIIIDGDQSVEMVLNGIEKALVECLEEEEEEEEENG
jgi:deoxyadenosine/deoxycytidine kinase